MQYEKDELIGAVKELIAVMKDSGLSYMSVKNDNFEVELGEKPAPMPAMPPMPMMPPMGAMAPAVTPPYNPSAAPKAEAKVPELSGKIVKSPIVGTFYAAPAPGKPPYAPVGKTVAKGDILFIIESMKLMNEVTSEFDGTVAEILVKDGDAVEFDQPIMRLQ